MAENTNHAEQAEAWQQDGDNMKLMEINEAIHDLDARLTDLEMALRINEKKEK